MIKVGSMVQSKYRLSSGKEGNLGLVLSLMADGKIARVFWASTQKSGFCSVVDLKVVA